MHSKFQLLHRTVAGRVMCLSLTAKESQWDHCICRFPNHLHHDDCLANTHNGNSVSQFLCVKFLTKCRTHLSQWLDCHCQSVPCARDIALVNSRMAQWNSGWNNVLTESPVKLHEATMVLQMRHFTTQMNGGIVQCQCVTGVKETWMHSMNTCAVVFCPSPMMQ